MARAIRNARDHRLAEPGGEGCLALRPPHLDDPAQERGLLPPPSITLGEPVGRVCSTLASFSRTVANPRTSIDATKGLSGPLVLIGLKPAAYL
jgi:hypothetical protein